MMNVAKKDYSFYGIFDISKVAFEDIKQRLVKQELDWKYLLKDTNGREVIVFGTTALRAEIDENNHSG